MSPPRSNRRVLGRRGSFASAEEQCSAGAALPPPRSSHRLEGAQLCAGAPRHKYTLYRCRGAAQRKKGGYVAAAQQAQGRHLWRRTAPCSRATARVPLPKKAQGGGGMAPPRSSHRRGGTKLRASEPRLECRWRDGAGGADALAVHTCTCTCYARTTSPRLTRDMLAHASEANGRCLQARYSTEAAGTAAAAAAAAASAAATAATAAAVAAAAAAAHTHTHTHTPHLGQGRFTRQPGGGGELGLGWKLVSRRVAVDEIPGFSFSPHNH